MGLTRSEQMSRIHRSNTTPEVRLRSLLWAAGHRYRLRLMGLPCRPDLLFPGARVAVFVDGCFWHGCPEHYVRPRTGARFWASKLRENVSRDRRQFRQLANAGWRVVRLWEHEVLAAPDAAVRRVQVALRGQAEAEANSSWRVYSARPIDRAGRWERRVLVLLEPPLRKRVQRHRRHTRKW